MGFEKGPTEFSHFVGLEFSERGRGLTRTAIMHLCMMKQHWLYLYPIGKRIASADLRRTTITPKSFWSTSTVKADHQHKPTTRLLHKSWCLRERLNRSFSGFLLFFPPETMIYPNFLFQPKLKYPHHPCFKSHHLPMERIHHLKASASYYSSLLASLTTCSSCR